MSKNQIIVLVQLGGFDYGQDNTIDIEAPLTPPLSLGYLKVYTQQRDPNLDILILEPWAIMNQTPQEIGELILSYSPRIAGFSCYVWNIEATKEVIRYIKQEDSSLYVVIGGPEVYNLNHLHSESSIDVGVLGEGEEPFYRLVSYILQELPVTGIPGTVVSKHCQQAPKIKYQSHQLNSRDIPCPYANNTFKLHHYKHLYMETFRGCCFQCLYCYYHKQVPRVNFFPLEHIKSEIQAAMTHRIKYIIFIDSVLNLPQWGEQVCQLLAALNKDESLEFSADIHAELVSESFCRSAQKANFTEFQVGLQTINPQTLKNINRKLNLNHFARGLELLNHYEIPVNVDLILGLPRDTIEDIWQAVKFLRGFNIKSIRVALLRVLPGTDLWNKYKHLNLGFDEKSPYFIKHSDKISEAEIWGFFKGENHRVF
jgi:radical SAM superfamily enzyme YgiQ (UPF0313 family)